MKCVHCGTENQNNNKFCTKCGELLNSPEEITPKCCLSCGAPITPKTKFCTECGAPVSDSTDTADADNKPATQSTVVTSQSQEAEKIKINNSTPPSPPLSNTSSSTANNSHQPQSKNERTGFAKLLYWYKKWRRASFYFAGVVLLILFVMSLFGPNNIDEVKKMHFDSFSKTITMGQALDRAFDKKYYDTEWTEKSEHDINYVIFKAQKKNSPEYYEVHFTVTTKGKYIYASLDRIIHNAKSIDNELAKGLIMRKIYNNEINN